MKWKREEVEFLKQNYDAKISLEELARKINRSRQSVKRKAQNLNLHRKWVRFNKPIKHFSRKEIDRRYYFNNKEKVYFRRTRRRKRLKEEAISLLGGKCNNCGYNKCLAALDFHHAKNNKEGNIHDFIKNESREKLLKEAKKCILLCANCHRELHYKGSVI